MRKISKKGIMMDVVEFLIVAGIIALLTVIILIIIWFKDRAALANYNLNLAQIDASKNTRILLEYDLEDNYKLYEAIIDGINNNDFEFIENSINKAIDGFYGSSSNEQWIYLVNDVEMSYKMTKRPDDIIDYLPYTYVPNPYGETIKVMIKRITPTDYYNPLPLENLQYSRTNVRPPSQGRR